MINLTLAQFLEKNQCSNESADRPLSILLNDISSACKHIALAISEGALVGTMGSLESENVQGEVQKQLDVITNEIFIKR